MNDMSAVIVPKSDQINADDLIPGPITITIRDVQIRGGQEQPVSIFFDGSEKAFRPCKSMSRVLVAAWGPDAKVYIGRSLTLYRDPTVKWGGMEVGGIRISHMSNIDGKLTMALTATKGSRKPYTVMPLVDAPKPPQQQAGGRLTAAQFTRDHIAAVQNAETIEALEQILSEDARGLARLKSDKPDLYADAELAANTRRAQLERPGKWDEDDGEPFTDDDSADVRQQLVDTICRMAEEAEDEQALSAAQAELDRHRSALPPEAIARADAAIAAARRVLASA